MTLELLKPDLPNMPDEVIEVWLMTHYSRFGWPPSSNRDWKYIFGIDRDFEYFQRMNWERGDIEITPRDLTPKALNVLLGMVQRDYFGVFNEYSFMSDSKERLQSCISYMNEHGKFPKPVILHATPEGYEIMQHARDDGLRIPQTAPKL